MDSENAGRMKLLAEECIRKEDYFGAKYFALAAQALDTNLAGISQLLATIEVYITAQNKIDGETDWYGILGVNPTDTEEAIKKQYRKLALVLHPDKNRSIGADGAFQVISRAWRLISDKAQRLAYDLKRGIVKIESIMPMQTDDPSPAPSREYNFMGTSTASGMKQGESDNMKSTPPSASASMPDSTSRAQQPTRARARARAHARPRPRPRPAPTPAHDQGENSFWTQCQHCNIYYEYAMRYLDQTLRCPNCKEAYFARRTNPPRNVNINRPGGEVRNPSTSGQTSRSEQATFPKTASTSTEAYVPDVDPGPFMFGARAQVSPFSGQEHFGSGYHQTTGSSVFGQFYPQGHGDGGFSPFPGYQHVPFFGTGNTGGTPSQVPGEGQADHPNFSRPANNEEATPSRTSNMYSFQGRTCNVGEQGQEQPKRASDSLDDSIGNQERNKKGKWVDDDNSRCAFDLNMPPPDETFKEM